MDVTDHSDWAEVHRVEAVKFAVSVLRVVFVQKHRHCVYYSNAFLENLTERVHHGEMLRALPINYDVESIHIFAVSHQNITHVDSFERQALEALGEFPALEFVLFHKRTRLEDLLDNLQVLLGLCLLGPLESADQLLCFSLTDRFHLIRCVHWTTALH